MSFLTLVRHAQASFFAADYDRLSERGAEQARILGEYWVRQPLIFSEVYLGPRARHLQTVELVAGCFHRAGLPWPEPVVRPEFDEYDLAGMLHKLLPELARRDAAFAQLAQPLANGVSSPGYARNFQKMFEALTGHWQTLSSSVAAAESRNEESLDGFESWPAFRERVQSGLRRIVGQPGNGRRVAVFTSGGFIGTALHLALATSDRTALELNWRIRNCSLTEFVFSGNRLTLDAFNAVPHLENSALWTYR
jgi:broad specificity phosphatase PhoE